MIDDRDYHNYLARAAWLLADCRSYLQRYENKDMVALDLVERCDDYFLETYRWLLSQEGTARATSPTTAPPAESPGVDWKAPTLLESPETSFPSELPASTTEPATRSGEATSNPSFGGTPLPARKLSVDFF